MDRICPSPITFRKKRLKYRKQLTSLLLGKIILIISQYIQTKMKSLNLSLTLTEDSYLLRFKDLSKRIRIKRMERGQKIMIIKYPKKTLLFLILTLVVHLRVIANCANLISTLFLLESATIKSNLSFLDSYYLKAAIKSFAVIMVWEWILD
jgi:hypothetical protein